MKEKVILLIEDNPMDEELTLRALRKNGILNRVVVAHDGAEALDCLFGKGVQVDRDILELPAVIVLDLKLPKVDGLDVIRRIRSDARTRRLPVVIFTSSNEDKDLRDGYGVGANSYVRKPVKSSEFENAVHQLGLYWLVLNEKPPADPPLSL